MKYTHGKWYDVYASQFLVVILATLIVLVGIPFKLSIVSSNYKYSVVMNDGNCKACTSTGLKEYDR